MLRSTARAIENGRVGVYVLGDSIACGSDVTRNNNSFVQLWASRFEETHGVPVMICNRALPGLTIRDGYREARRSYGRFRAELVVIAFGVNDQTPGRFGRPKITPDNFWRHALALGDHFTPADVVFVTPLNPSRSWDGRTGEIDRYSEKLRQIVADRKGRRSGLALADVTAAWPGDHLLSNGINHPDDEGHRLYADVLTATVEAGLVTAGSGAAEHQPVNVLTVL